MKTKYIFLATMLIICISTFSYSNGFGQSNQDKNYHIPKYEKTNGDTLVRYSSYFALYNYSLKISKWVAYTIEEWQIEQNVKKRKKVKPDNKIDKTVKKNDYSKKNFHKGHQVPASHRAYDNEVATEVSYLTNITPQHKDLNQGIWKDLEQICSDLTSESEKLYITTGVISTRNKRIRNKVVIPDFYFKAILIQYENEFKAIGFIIPNKEPKGTCLCSYVVTIDSLENLTGLDFFSQLDLTIQNKIESEIDSKLLGIMQ